jgi:DNA-binding MarR family transcriptional regulator
MTTMPNPEGHHRTPAQPVILVVPSEGGRHLHARVRTRANDLLSELLDTFDPEDRERLAPSMERLIAAVETQRGSPGPSASRASW